MMSLRGVEVFLSQDAFLEHSSILKCLIEFKIVNFHMIYVQILISAVNEVLRFVPLKRFEPKLLNFIKTLKFYRNKIVFSAVLRKAGGTSLSFY